MPVRGVDFFYYPVKDMQRAVVFFRDVLGLEPAEAYGDQWVEFNAGGVTVALDGSQEMPVAVGDAGLRPAAAFACDNLDTVLETVRESGARVIVEPVAPGSCRFAVVADPDGNPVILHRRDDGTFG